MDERKNMRVKWMLAALVVLACYQAQAESLFENTNLALFEVVPDVLAEEIKPYDERLWETDERINGKLCCDRKMYRVGEKKVVILSHEGLRFLVIVINGKTSRMFFAEEPGVFIEQPVEKGGTWKVPDWLRTSG